MEQRVTQETTENASLLPLIEAVARRGAEMPQRVSADWGLFSLENLQGLEARGIEGYEADSNLPGELNGRGRRPGWLHHAGQRRMRQRLRSPSGRALYQLRASAC